MSLNKPGHKRPKSQPAASGGADVVAGFRARLEHVLANDGSPGQSNFQAMVESMESGNEVSKPCWKCDGLGYWVPSKRQQQQNEAKIEELMKAQSRAETSEEGDRIARSLADLRYKIRLSTVCPQCDGVGCLESHRGRLPVEWWVSTQCYHCRATGATPQRNLEFENPGNEQDLCPVCGQDGRWSREEPWRGEGFTVPVTSRPTGGRAGGYRWSGGSATDGSVETVRDCGAMAPWDVDLEDHETQTHQYGRILRMLSAVRAENAGLAAAVETFCGPEGTKWAGRSYGRTFALWPLTRAGRVLLEKSTTTRVGTPCDRLASERQHEARSQDQTGRRRMLIRQADEEARGMRRMVERKLEELEQ